VRVVVPATPRGLHPLTVPAILEAGYVAEVHPMLIQESYWELLRGLWDEGNTFAIVEHDIGVTRDQLFALEDCGRPWCAFSYEVYAGDLAAAYGGPYGLGCTRFRYEILQKIPGAVEEAGTYDQHPVHPPRSYAVMDSTLTRVLRSHGHEPHQHFPNVVHRHVYNRADAFVPAPVES
jgi:hypothetical protein